MYCSQTVTCNQIVKVVLNSHQYSHSDDISSFFKQKQLTLNHHFACSPKPYIGFSKLCIYIGVLKKWNKYVYVNINKFSYFLLNRNIIFTNKIVFIFNVTIYLGIPVTRLVRLHNLPPQTCFLGSEKIREAFIRRDFPKLGQTIH